MFIVHCLDFPVIRFFKDSPSQNRKTANLSLIMLINALMHSDIPGRHVIVTVGKQVKINY